MSTLWLDAASHPRIEDPDTPRRILDCRKRPAGAPPLAEVPRQSGEPLGLEGAEFFDQSAGCDSP